MIQKTDQQNYYLLNRGTPRGCQLCLKGMKAVLFINGICQKPAQCSWYCPISEKRKGKSTSYINEIKINKQTEIFDEIRRTDARGLSITGGEPLSTPNLDITLSYIQLIKTTMGPKFHIHLYSNGCQFNKTIAKKLSEVGLDEIRFHPPHDKWEVIEDALGKGMDVGAEVPVIPDETHETQLNDFILYLDRIGANFINLNEFEYCFPNSKELRKRGFELKRGSIASVKDSKRTALRLINQLASKTSLKIHFCSIKAKDYFQLKERYLRRAQNIKTPYEEVTDEGLLLYGQIEGTREQISKFREYLLKESDMPRELLSFESEKILLPYYVLIDDEFEDFLKEFGLHGYIIEGLPFNKYREKEYHQITEKAPIDVFKQEQEYYED